MPYDTESLSTRLTRLGRDGKPQGGRPVNPPLVRMSTALFETAADMRDFRIRRNTERVVTYGARGTPTTHALEDVITELEGGYRTRLFPTGLAAIAHVFLTYLRPGDHVLIADSVYQPVRGVAEQFLTPFGITFTYFAADGQGIEGLLRPETKLIYVETPGSFAFELCDVPRLAALAKSHGILLAADNTWGAGILYRPLDLGADISVTAATKYLSGHSDVMMGAVTTTAEAWPRLNAFSDMWGVTVSPDDCWLILRGCRTLAARLMIHDAHARRIAQWLETHPAVKRVYSPILESHPTHHLWLRDCRGTNGLLSFTLHRSDGAAVDLLMDSLQLFGIGASWGGYESLITYSALSEIRSVNPGPDILIRLHIGLEDPDDLIADLRRGLDLVQTETRRSRGRAR